MSDNQNQVESLINGLDSKDSRLAALLRTLAGDLYSLDRQINPPTSQSVALNPGGNVVTIDSPSNFMATVFPNNIRLSWDPVGTEALLYVIKLGSSYATAVTLATTANLSFDVDPVSRLIATGASYTFWIVAQCSNGFQSVPESIVVVIPVIGAPSITPVVLQNYITLSWTVPTSTFTIAKYIITRNGAFYAYASGTFAAIFELSAGVYAYTIQAVDIVGNLGTPSPSVTLSLTAPTDYITQGVITSTFTGSFASTFFDKLSNHLIAPVDITETWAQHFSNNGWANINDQVNAGFPIYAEPSKAAGGTYTETFDFGGIFANVIVSLSYNTVVLVGSVSINFTIAVSTDNITFDAPQAGTTRFASSVRYVKVVATFTPSPTTKSLIEFFNYICTLAVHQETDSGQVNAVASDATGTVVTFAKAYKIVNAINATVKQPTNARWVIVNYDFTTLNPTTFKVLVFDNAGVRQSELVTWISKGTL